MKAILIVGLPASGKSTYIKTIREGAEVIDDFLTRNIPVADKLIIADPYLCKENFRNRIKEVLEWKGYEVDFIYYENNPDQCHINAQNRPEKKVDGFIDMLSWEYNPPRVDRKVWNGKS